MIKANNYLRLFLSVAVAVSMLPVPRGAQAQDLVASDDLAGGSSVFVFRESRKKPQVKAAGGQVVHGAGGRQISANNAQMAAAAKKRRAVARRQAAIASANRKIALSNTLTAKAEGFLDSDQTDLAISNYRAALVQNPKNTRASEGLSNALTGKGIDAAGATNSDAAIPLFDEAIKLDKQNDVAYAKLGAIYDSRGQKEKAIANYESAIKINPEFSMIYPSLGLLYADAGEVAKAENCLQKSEAASIDSVDSRFLRGVLQFKQNKNQEALASFDRVLELDGRFAEAQYYRGQVLDRLGKNDQSIAAYKTTLEIEPSFAPASFDLGVAYYNQGDYNGAATAYQQTIKLDNNNSQAHANLASTYRQLERYPEANAEYKLASTGIKTPDLYSEWGYCLGKTNEWDKSVARLQTAKELSPTAIDNTNLGWGYYNEANAQTAAKDDAAAKANYALAKSTLEVAVQQDPKLDAAYLNLGSTHNALGEFQLAVNVLKTALGLHRDWGIATNQLGLGYRGLGDLVNAVAAFKRVVDMDGRNSYGLYNLGEAYFASGNKKEAKKVNDQLKKIDPSLSSRLDSVFSGKAVVDAAKNKVEQKIPKIPRFPL